jgi:hypothetical protein
MLAATGPASPANRRLQMEADARGHVTSTVSRKPSVLNLRGPMAMLH